MKKTVKLVSNGNATAVNIPRAILYHLGWKAGDLIIAELREDRTIRLRAMTPYDLPAYQREFPEPATTSAESR